MLRLAGKHGSLGAWSFGTLEPWNIGTLEQIGPGIWNSIFFLTFGNPFIITSALWIMKF
jgi:hypothetical protein